MNAISRIGLVLSLAVVAATAGCSSSPPITAEVGQGWRLQWDDEFSGKQLDTTKGSFETNCWGGGNGEQECYTSARLRTLGKGDFTYGRIEVRAELPGGQGLWPAIWMLPSDKTYGDWAASGEIDIMEAVNLGTTPELPVYGTLHYGGVSPTTLDACATRSPDAQVLAGKKPPGADDIAYDPNFINQDVVTAFDNTVVGPFKLGTYAASGDVKTSFVDDLDRGPVTQIEYNADESVAYFQSLESFDFTPFKSLEFDAKVGKDPRASGGYTVRMDCTYPCTSGDYPIDLPNDGQWHHFSIPLADLVANPKSNLDLTIVNTPLVISPDTGNQKGVVLLVDNVQVVR